MRSSRFLRGKHGEKPNITGFDMTKFVNSRRPKYDPWAAREAWRYTGQFTRFNRFKNALPGFGTAVVAFSGYLVYEHFFMKPAHHDEGHGEEKH